VAFRPPCYVDPNEHIAVIPGIPEDQRIPLFVNERHSVHHVKDRGYVEAPIRISAILKTLESSGLFVRHQAKHVGEQYIEAVHDRGYIEYFKRVCSSIAPGKSLYPYVFPIRNRTRPPKEVPVRAGYYCIDTFTPLNQNAYLAAKRAVDCAVSAAQCVLGGQPLAYALVRPPGHHAERESFGGFCYFNNAAVAAQYLSAHGKVAILDVDYHHGNGQQDIFYTRPDVFTVSIHGHPRFAYPYFSGFEDERGEAAGTGFNLNLPLGEALDGEGYRKALERALRKIKAYAPDFLVVCLGLDTAKGDPTGTWSLAAKDFAANAKLIGGLGLPTVVIQEGGYRTRSLGANAIAFFRAFSDVLK
jgi:acetoin utilization deacetylase AcuC-like enzyme